MFYFIIMKYKTKYNYKILVFIIIFNKIEYYT